MKLYTILIVILICACFSVCAEVVPKAQEGVKAPQTLEKAEEYTKLKGLERGFANMLLGAIELPRNMFYYSVEYPVVGLVPGTLQGAGLTIMRVVGGVADLITVGYLSPGRTVYDLMEIPLYPWESPWMPEPKDPNDYEPSSIPILY
jgi:putative exosortase-associated protein (TIGR04073 family)